MKKSITPAATRRSLLNPKYCNTNTPANAIVWNKIYTLTHSYFVNSDPYKEAPYIINSAGGTQAFKLMKLASLKKKQTKR